MKKPGRVSDAEDLAAFAARLLLVRRSYARIIDRPHMAAGTFAAELGIEAARYRRYERGEMQPPIPVLTAIRKVTGVSLCWLVSGMESGSQPGEPAPRPGKSTVSDRLRWARLTQEMWMEACADVMRVPPEQWQRYESGLEPLPLEVAKEFSHRFSVSLDYLYLGSLPGIAPVVRRKLVADHPELIGPRVRSRTHKAKDDGSTSPAEKKKGHLNEGADGG